MPHFSVPPLWTLPIYQHLSNLIRRNSNAYNYQASPKAKFAKKLALGLLVFKTQIWSGDFYVRNSKILDDLLHKLMRMTSGDEKNHAQYYPGYRESRSKKDFLTGGRRGQKWPPWRNWLMDDGCKLYKAWQEDPTSGSDKSAAAWRQDGSLKACLKNSIWVSDWTQLFHSSTNPVKTDFASGNLDRWVPFEVGFQDQHVMKIKWTKVFFFWVTEHPPEGLCIKS